MLFLITHPSSPIPHPSSLIPHPSSLIPHPSSLIPHPSSLIPHPSSLIPHPSSLIPHPSSACSPRNHRILDPQHATTGTSRQWSVARRVGRPNSPIVRDQDINGGLSLGSVGESPRSTSDRHGAPRVARAHLGHHDVHASADVERPRLPSLGDAQEQRSPVEAVEDRHGVRLSVV